MGTRALRRVFEWLASIPCPVLLARGWMRPLRLLSVVHVPAASIIQELVRNTDSWCHLRSPEAEYQGMGPGNLGFNQAL